MLARLPVWRVLLVWVLMAVAMSANGIFREVALKRAFSSAFADVASAVTGVAIILVITRWGFHPLAGATNSQRAAVSAFLVVMTVGFECAMGRYVDHKSWQVLLENYAIWRGHLWPAVLVVLSATPFIWARA
jgi:hypothetical protein